MDWMIGVTELDAQQRRVIDAVIESGPGNHWIKGFAGSGKTIVLTHILKRMAMNSATDVCFATFTHALKEMVESGLTSRERDRITSTTFDSATRLTRKFDVIIADEIQDVRSEHLISLRKRGKSFVFAADPAQRIYNWAMKTSALESAMKPVRSHQLRRIHRINKPVYEVATAVYSDAQYAPGDIPDDDLEPVLLIKARTRSDEFNTVLAEATRLARPGSPSAILFPTNNYLKMFIDDVARTKGWGPAPAIRNMEAWSDPFGATNSFLENQASPLQLFGSKSGSIEESDNSKVVYLMTYHNAKGLEFPYVFLPHLNSSIFSTADDKRRLFFVAATRTKERLYLSYHGTAHPFVKIVSKLGNDTVRKFQPRPSY